MSEVLIRLLSGRSVAFESGAPVGEVRRRLAEQVGHPLGLARASVCARAATWLPRGATERSIER
eukprot:12709893-Alexandrium_andersonii.AAC.1